jgi:hypothetical protein
MEKDDNPSTFPRDLKRRKLLHTPENNPDYLYADSKGNEEFEVRRDEDPNECPNDDLQHIHSSPCERAACLDQVGEVMGEDDYYLEPLKRITPVDQRGLYGNLFQSLSGLPTRSRRNHHAYPINGKFSLNLDNAGT